eukprot:Opistho-2@41255
MVNGSEIGKEWQNILDLEQVTAVDKRHCFFDVALLLDDVAGNLQPQLLPQGVVVLGSVGVDLCEIHINLDGQVDSLLKQAHRRVNVHARTQLPFLLAQSERVLEIKDDPRLKLLIEEGQQTAIVLHLGVQGQKIVVDGGVLIFCHRNTVLEIPYGVVVGPSIRSGIVLVVSDKRWNKSAWLQPGLAHPCIHRLLRRMQHEYGRELVVQFLVVLLAECAQGNAVFARLNEVVNNTLVIVDKRCIEEHIVHAAVARNQIVGCLSVQIVLNLGIAKKPAKLQLQLALRRRLSLLLEHIELVKVHFNQPRRHHDDLRLLRKFECFQLLEEI